MHARKAIVHSRLHYCAATRRWLPINGRASALMFHSWSQICTVQAQGNGSPAASVAVIAGGRKKQKANFSLVAPYCKICHRRGFCCHFQGGEGAAGGGGISVVSTGSLSAGEAVGGVGAGATRTPGVGMVPLSHRTPVSWSGRSRDVMMQIGVHSPTASTLIGALHGVDKSGYVCGFCSRNGHEEYECPVMWMETFPTEGPLPGFTAKGDVLVEDWEGGKGGFLSRVGAGKWIDLRQRGYFQCNPGGVRTKVSAPHPVDSIVRCEVQMRARDDLHIKIRDRQMERATHQDSRSHPVGIQPPLRLCESTLCPESILKWRFFASRASESAGGDT